MRVLSTSKLKAFQLAGMTASFKHAAHLLSISPSAVSARVRSLESDLGVRLFHRGIRKLTLTEAGAAYIREVEATFVSFDMATRDLCTRFGEITGAASQSPDSPAKVAAALAFSSEHGQVPGQDWA
jgi:LysR family glycine cleavage system transcriptional activator